MSLPFLLPMLLLYTSQPPARYQLTATNQVGRIHTNFKCLSHASPCFQGVVLRAGNHNLNDCRWQSYLYLWVGWGFAVGSWIPERVGRIRRSLKIGLYRLALACTGFQCLLHPSPTPPLPSKGGHALRTGTWFHFTKHSV